MKKYLIFKVFISVILFQSLQVNAQQEDIRYLSSGGKLGSVQANMDIRHYAIKLMVDIQNHSINTPHTLKLLTIITIIFLL